MKVAQPVSYCDESLAVLKIARYIGSTHRLYKYIVEKFSYTLGTFPRFLCPIVALNVSEIATHDPSSNPK